jgi:hypothetical protein
MGSDNQNGPKTLDVPLSFFDNTPDLVVVAYFLESREKEKKSTSMSCICLKKNGWKKYTSEIVRVVRRNIINKLKVNESGEKKKEKKT